MPPAVPTIIFFILLSAGIVRAVPGDNLADRILLSSYQSRDATTVSAGLEPGEINEAAQPARAQDRSLWFEWQAPPSEGRLILTASFSSETSRKGLAAYSLPEFSTPVSMPVLQPAGFAPAEPGPRQPTFVLWHQPGERIIIRVWTTPAVDGASDSGSAVRLFLGTYQRDRSEGDSPNHPRRFLPGEIESTRQDRTLSAYIGGMYGLGARNTTESLENLIGGQWYPTSAPFWYEWEALRTERFRFSLGGDDADEVRLLIAKRRENLLDLVSAPGTTTAFNAIAGEKYLLRISHVANNSPELLTAFLYGGPAEPGDEPATAVPLLPGTSKSVRITGAGPPKTPLPEDFLHPGGAIPEWPPLPRLRPDVWFNLGSSLNGPFNLDAGGGTVTIYNTNADSQPVTRVAGGPLSPDARFRAETGQHYLARVMWVNVTDAQPPPWNVRLETADDTPPVNDSRENALVLDTAQLPLVTRGDAANAMAEESDWLADEAPTGRTVWYVLDPTGSVDQPWFVFAWNTTTLPVQAFREENGALVSARHNGWPGDPFGQFLPAGQRVWIRVSGIADPRFMLMAGPSVSPGDNFADALTLTPGEVRYLSPGMATTEPDEPNQSPYNLSVWLKWTATSAGRVHFSTMGSASARRTHIYSGPSLTDLAAVPATTYLAHDVTELPGRVESFEAQAGITYHFQTNSFGVSSWAPFAVRLQPGGWDSPWEVWRQNWPAWDGVASLDEPLADTDGDGISNLMEMALYGPRSPCVPDSADWQQPQLWYDPINSPGAQVTWFERTYALRGPAGCTPLFLTGEASPDGIHWAPVHEPALPSTIPLQYRTYQLRSLPNPLPANFFRLRVHR